MQQSAEVRPFEETDSAEEISELSLRKIGLLTKSRDPPLSRALLLSLVLKRVTKVQDQPRHNVLRGFMNYIASIIGQPLTFINYLQNAITQNNEAQKDEMEVEEEEETENEFKQVRYEELIGIRNVGTMARKARLAEEEKMRHNWRLLQEKGKCGVRATRSSRLKRDPSAELIKGIVNPTLLEVLPPDRFFRVASH